MQSVPRRSRPRGAGPVGRLGVAALVLLTCLAAALQAAGPRPTRESAIPTGAVKVTPAADAYPPVLHADGYEPPVPVPGALNTAGAEDSPFVAPDGKTLWFFFTPSPSVPPEGQLVDGVTGIWVAREAGGKWAGVERVVLQDKGKLALDGAACVQDDTLWFCSARAGSIRDVDMWTARRSGKGWRDWENAGRRLNGELQVGELHAMPGGKEIYFHAARPGGKGKLDIWLTRKVGDKWQEPESVDAVNSPEDDGWPFVTADGKELWFTRWYRGSPAIYRSRLSDGKWGSPELILSQFAAEPTVDRDGNVYFAHHFFRDGKMLEADIYVARRKKP